jgi:hypothetical protein
MWLGLGSLAEVPEVRWPKIERLMSSRISCNLLIIAFIN